ncbi:hypothetical protein JCM9534A_00060 [Catenuloplanes indicus JCM 9534]
MIDGLCPCGAEPRADDPYCSDDCRPTHRGPDTTWSAMRWRPAPVGSIARAGPHVRIDVRVPEDLLVPEYVSRRLDAFATAMAAAVRGAGEAIAASVVEVFEHSAGMLRPSEPLWVWSTEPGHVMTLNNPDGYPHPADSPDQASDPMLAVIEARRRRGPHGPQPRRRAPRRLDPSRRR